MKLGLINLFRNSNFKLRFIDGTNAHWRLSRQLSCDSACDLLGGVQSSLRFPPSGGKSDPDQTLFESLGGPVGTTDTVVFSTRVVDVPYTTQKPWTTLPRCCTIRRSRSRRTSTQVRERLIPQRGVDRAVVEGGGGRGTRREPRWRDGAGEAPGARVFAF